MASLPLVSILAIFWLYFESKDVEQVANLASGIFWMVFPSLLLFLLLPYLLRQGVNCYLAMLLSVGVIGLLVENSRKCLFLVSRR